MFSTMLQAETTPCPLDGWRPAAAFSPTLYIRVADCEAEIIGAYTREKFAEEYLDGCRTFFCADTKLGIFSVFFLFDKTNQTDNGGGTDENGTARGGADRSFEAAVAFLYKYKDGKSGASDAVVVTEAQAVVGEGDDRPDGESEQPVDKSDQKE